MTLLVNVAVALVVSSVPIDLSQYAENLVKNCIPLLGSQIPGTRLDTHALVGALALQCSDASTVQLLLQLLSAALKSRDSKL